ncbi:efflux RND transporter periplasmic adaptor subunit [Cohnella boryungensis]|uniref:Efflux RND transporter periplasmic adaptor subunit n=1 Tax=Cohnella boryungensis TaxID=768479 RepID=A0ABV8SJ75_9BACL
MKKRILWSVVAAIAIAAGVWAGLRYWNMKDVETAPALPTTKVRKGTIEVKVSGTGTIQPSARETIKAGSSGTAFKVHVKEGDIVRKGDVLVTYEEEDNASQVRSKEIDLKKKKLELADLQTKFKQAGDDEAREAIALSIQKQQLDIESAQADIADLKADKGVDPIVSPIGGTVTSFKVNAGDVLNPNSEIGEIVNYAQLQMVVGIDELDIPKVRLDQSAEILVEALPDEKFTGKVVSIADEGSSSNGVASFDVTVALTEIDNLMVGMSAEASILTAQKADALYVPVEAVQSSQGKYFVLTPVGAAAGTPGSAEGNSAGPGREAPQQEPNQGQGQSSQGDQGGGSVPGQMPQGRNDNAERFQSMSEEERAAMRERFMANRGSGGTASATVGATSTMRVEVEIGINNEDSIEIVSGLQEGDVVVLPAVTGSSSSSQSMQGGFPGIGGGGFVGGAGGGMPGGGFGGNGGRQSSGGGAGAGGAR